MKYSIMFSLLFCLGLGLKAQTEFAPIGAEWKIRGISTGLFQNQFDTCESSDCTGNLISYRSVSNENIGGKECRKIEIWQGFSADSIQYTGDNLYLYQEEEKVYFYNDRPMQNACLSIQADTFLLLFDFGLHIGDTLFNYSYQYFASKYSLNEPSLNEGIRGSNIISAIDTLMINGSALRQFTIENTSFNLECFGQVPRKLIEGIGCIGNFFGDSGSFNDDQDCYGRFLCYQDLDKKYSVFGEDCPCIFQQQTTHTIDKEEEYNIQCYPNPTEQLLHLSGVPDNSRLVLHDLLGNAYPLAWKESKSINIEYMETGVYYLAIFSAEKALLETIKLVKN